MECAVRPMVLADVDQVRETEVEAFSPQWPATPFARELRQPIARFLVAYELPTLRKDQDAGPSSSGEGAAAEGTTILRRLASRLHKFLSPAELRPVASERVLGYVGLWVVQEAHITAIAVRESHRRRGIGELLLIAALDHTSARRCQGVILEVRVSNVTAQALYEKYGFTRLSVRRGYYTDNNEDAFVMGIEALISPAYQARLEELKRAHMQRWGPARVELPA